jgi:ADP-heptose:LPS heptosyltransferase
MILIFFPYGIGDVIMATPGLRRLCEKFEPKDIVVILANNAQEEALLTLIDLPIRTIISKHNEFLGSLKLYFKILFLNPEIIYAPMINSFKSRILFFLLLNKKTFVPSKVIKSKIFNLYPANDSLESFNGHEVNYLISFFNLGHNKIESKPMPLKTK